MNNLDCTYVQSRRGYVGGRRKRNEPYPAATEHPASGLHSNVSTKDVPLHSSHRGSGGLPTPSSDGTIDLDHHVANDIVEEPWINVFYQNIHPAHPFVIPRRLYKQNPDFLPPYLKCAMQYAVQPLLTGHNGGLDTFRDIIKAFNLADGFQVQALLLLTITSYASGEREQGDVAIRQAVETAFHIGLDSEDFGIGCSAVIQESWRRTWWELYSICGIIRVLTPTIPKLDPPYSRLVPCHDTAFNSCQVTASRTFSQMQDRHFVDDNFDYSGFAYRVEAVRILNNILDFTAQDSYQAQPSPAFHSCRASIKSYTLSLPVDRQNGILPNGETDELMFCALTIINVASILLNIPHSKLARNRSFGTICVTQRPSNMLSRDETACTIAAVNSADAIIRLLIDRNSESMKSMSPCSACVLAFAATTHLAAYCLVQDEERMRCLKEYLEVSLGALNTIGRSWPIARMVKGQLVEFSREIMMKPLPQPPMNYSRVQQVQLEDVVATMPLSHDIVPGIEDTLWLQDLLNSEGDFSFVA